VRMRSSAGILARAASGAIVLAWFACRGAAQVPDAVAARALSWNGGWDGQATVAGQPMGVSVTVAGRDGGALAATFDVPGRSRCGVPFSRFEVDGGRCSARLNDVVLGELELNAQRDGSILRGTLGLVTPDGRPLKGEIVLVRVPDDLRRDVRPLCGDYAFEGLGRIHVDTVFADGRQRLRAYAASLSSTDLLTPLTRDRYAIGLAAGGDAPPILEFIERNTTTGDDGPDVWLERAGRRLAGRRRNADLHLDAAAISAELDARRAAAGIPGMSVAIVRGADVVYEDAFGLRDVERGKPVEPDTLFQIGSVTKTFTASLLARLDARGVVGLGAPLALLLPKGRALRGLDEFSRRALTLERLATHTAGLMRDPPVPRGRDGAKLPTSVDALWETVERSPLQFPVGERWSYSNLGFAILGEVLGEAAGTTYEELLRSELLDPLGLDDTTTHMTDEQRERFATHYWAEDQPRRARPSWDFGAVAGQGGIASTASDLAAWVSVQLGAHAAADAVLPAELRRELHEVHALRDGPRRAIGLAWWIDFDEDFGRIVHHGGEADGHSAYLAFSPLDGIGVVLLANLGGSASQEIGEWLLHQAIRARRETGFATLDDADTAFSDGLYGVAAWAYRRVLDECPKNSRAQYRLGVSLALQGEPGAARPWLERALAGGYAPAECWFALARLHAMQGRDDESFAALEKAVQNGFRDRDRIVAAPELSSLLEQSRFAGLLERVGR